MLLPLVWVLNLMPLKITDRLGPERVEVGWPWRLLLFSILVVVTVSVLYLGLEFGYKIYLNNQIESRDRAVAELTQTVSEEDQEKFISFYSQLANLQSLLDNHILTSRVFPFLEANTNRAIYYNFVDLKMKERRLNLEGVAQSYEIFAQQLEAFNQAPEVERLVVNESQSIGGRVSFRLFVILVPQLFK